MAADLTRTAWVLNLDADVELAVRGRYTPSARMRAYVAQNEGRARSLLGPNDRIVREGERLEPELRGIPGRAFCMTPRARRLLTEAGAVPVESPPFEILRRVNHRRFAAELGPHLPGARFVTTQAELAPLLDAAGAPSPTLLCKRAFGMSGRGQRRITPGALTDEDRRFVEASLASGGLAVEPFVRVILETSTHGWVERDGAIRVGAPHVQVCDARGAWLETRPPAPGELSPEDAAAIRQEAVRVAGALHGAGYFGPFGTDAFLYLDDDGQPRRNPLGEINARYTMGWAEGMRGA